jgi:hypothetical protein
MGFARNATMAITSIQAESVLNIIHYARPVILIVVPVFHAIQAILWEAVLARLAIRLLPVKTPIASQPMLQEYVMLAILDTIFLMGKVVKRWTHFVETIPIRRALARLAMTDTHFLMGSALSHRQYHLKTLILTASSFRA